MRVIRSVKHLCALHLILTVRHEDIVTVCTTGSIGLCQALVKRTVLYALGIKVGEDIIREYLFALPCCLCLCVEALLMCHHEVIQRMRHIVWHCLGGEGYGHFLSVRRAVHVLQRAGRDGEGVRMAILQIPVRELQRVAVCDSLHLLTQTGAVGKCHTARLMVERDGYDTLCLCISDRDVLGIAAVHGDRTHCRSSSTRDIECYVICSHRHATCCLQQDGRNRIGWCRLCYDGGTVTCGSGCHHRHTVAAVGRCVNLFQPCGALEHGEVIGTDSRIIYGNTREIGLSAYRVIRNLNVCKAAAAVTSEGYPLLCV